MIESLVFRIPTVSKDNEKFVYDLNLKKILENDRTTIYQNSVMRLCVNENIARILVFDKANDELIENLREYFYGKDYTSI